MDSEKLDQMKYRLQLLKALDFFQHNIHEIIDIGFQSKNTEDFKLKIIDSYNLSDNQAQIIADTQIKRITQLGQEDLQKEIKELSAAINNLETA